MLLSGPPPGRAATTGRTTIKHNGIGMHPGERLIMLEIHEKLLRCLLRCAEPTRAFIEYKRKMSHESGEAGIWNTVLVNMVGVWRGVWQSHDLGVYSLRTH